MTIDELMQSCENGEPTDLVMELLHELSSRVKIDLGDDFTNKLLGQSSTSGVELINRVLAEPQIMWKRFFFTELRKLT